MAAGGILRGELVPVARTADTAAVATALGLMLGLAEAAGAEAIVSAPKAKAPAATPASIDLLERIALDNAFPFDASVRRRSDVGIGGIRWRNSDNAPCGVDACPKRVPGHQEAELATKRR
jgi:hypothetical protein